MSKDKEFTHNGSKAKSFGLLFRSILMSVLYVLVWFIIFYLTK